MRNTIKAYLKTAEKAKADERAKPTTNETPQPEIVQQNVNGEVQEEEPPAEVDTAQAVDVTENGDATAVDVQPSIEVDLTFKLVLLVSDHNSRIPMLRRPITSTTTSISK